MNIKEDEQIPPGGCVVETEMGAVDARLETQMTAIKKALGLGM
jgi:flagellar biosynthesis/type III secretory pathway protein FliH